MKYIGIFLALGIVGCSSSSTNEAATPSTGGAAGQAGSNTGGEAGSSTGGAAGSGSSGGTTGGTGGVAGAAGTPSGGGTGGTCVPKTCLTYAVEHSASDACGTVSDGCGNYIDCGGCDTTNNQYSTCGGDPKPNADGSLNVGEPNICNGGCALVKPTGTLQFICSQEPPDHNNIWFCTTSLQVKPNSNAVSCKYKNEVGTSGVFAWCCTA